MINLLPVNSKEQLAFAKRNTVLRNWLLASCVGVIGILLVIAAGHLFISRSTGSTQKQVNILREQLGAQKLEQTQAHVTSISDSIKLTIDVLSRQIIFSKLLLQIGNAMPTGSTLTSLSIGSLKGGIDLTAKATSYQTATQVQINLADPTNKIFEKADIVNVKCSDNKTATGATVKDPYPCTVTIRALFAKDNNFQYVKQTAGAKP